MNGNGTFWTAWAEDYSIILLPIREAYEWKLFWDVLSILGLVLTCFQFVKRMNGNIHRDSTTATVTLDLLPIREAYEWKPAVPAAAAAVFKTLSCFQFVKRMNGNIFILYYVFVLFTKPCFQFVKRMNGNPQAHIIP